MLSNTTSKIGWKASDFALPAVDGRTYSLADARGPKGTLVVFICNHCPYVKASIGRIVAEAEALREIGVGTRPRKWHAPTTLSARRTSSASTPETSCSTAAGSMPRA
jgi:AhpC/TSA family